MNEDVSQVTYQEFHQTEENIYPSLTLCFSNIFKDEELRKYGVNNSYDYSEYLSGDYWNDQMALIDYDNVTMDLRNYMMGIVMWTPDWTYIYGDESYTYNHITPESSINTNGWKPDFYTSYRGYQQKCMTIDIPNTEGKKVWTFGTVFDDSIFPNSTRPDYYEFGVKVHYPGQLLRHQMQKYVWKAHNGDYITMKFKILKLEVIKLRASAKESCNKNWRNDDEITMLEEIKKVGCKPSYVKNGAPFPTCRSLKEMKTFSSVNYSSYLKPCNSLQKVLYSYGEYNDLQDWTKEWIDNVTSLFDVQLEFTDGTYMEIEQVRKYGPKDVIGDIGGYLGLFLGFALLQIPEMVFTVACKIDVILREKNKNIIENA